MTEGNRQVGDEIDFYCRRCRLNLHGNISSVVGTQVKTVTCRTCRGTVPYSPEKSEQEMRAGMLRKAFAIRDRRGQALAADAASRTEPITGGPEVTRRWREDTQEADARYAPRYEPWRTFEKGDFVIHSQHGLGVVTQVLHENAFLALFRKIELPLEMGIPRPDQEEE